MKRLLLSFFVFGAIAAAQSAPAFTVLQGYQPVTTRPCSGAQNVGSIYTTITNPSVTYICQQTGSLALGAGAFAWTQVPSSTTTGSIVIASGKTFTVNNTLTLAGTDSTTMTFPTTSATVARTDAANTFTGIQTLSSAPVLSTGTLTSIAATMTFPATSATLARTDAAQTFTGIQTFSSAPVIATITNTGTLTLPTATGGMPVVIACGATTGSTTCGNTATGATAKMYFGTATLASNTATITLGVGFTSSSTFQCIAQDQTTRANPSQAVPASATTFTLTNTTGASDVLAWACFGY